MRDARARASTPAAEIRVTADDVAHYAYARDGNAHAFNRVLRRKFGEVWRFGPVTSYNLNLTGIDTVGAKPADKPENAGECVNSLPSNSNAQLPPKY